MTGHSFPPALKQRAIAALLGVAAFALVLVITDPVGPGLDPDAMAYMGSAESVAAHATYRLPTAEWTSADSTEPLAHFPPGYSTALAIPIRLGMSPPQGARLVEAIAAFVTTFTLFLLVSAATSAFVGALFVIALFSMTSMHEVHVSVLSEPMFLACLALALYAMVRRPDHPLWAGIPAAVGIMTRYAGASLVGAAAIWTFMRPGTLAQRSRRAAIAVFPAVVLEAIWVIRTRASQGAEEIRSFAIYGHLGKTLAQGGQTLSAWLIPDPALDSDAIPYRGALAIAAGCSLAILVGIGAWHAWRSAPAPSSCHPGQREGSAPAAATAWRLLLAAFLQAACYIAVVMASRIFADEAIPLDERILSPALLLAMTIAAIGLAIWWRGTRLDIARLAVSCGLLGWWCAAALATYSEAHFALDWGSDFAGQQWRRSELLAWARADGARHPLYSNWPAAVYFYLHRPARELPKQRDLEPETLREFADTVRVRNGRVMLFNAPTGEYPSNVAMTRAPGLRVVARVADGIVLAASR